MPAPRFFAIVPAAGHSRRMGCNKLMLPWGGAPLLDHVLAAWQASRVERVVVTVRGDDAQVIEVCRRRQVDVVCPDPPPDDMRQSVQHALRHLATACRPLPDDVWMLAPADLPALTPDLIEHVMAACRQGGGIVVPRFGHRRGHPLACRWTLAAEVFALPEGTGINGLMVRHDVQYLDLPAQWLVDDVDTPEDYRRLCGGGS